MIITNPRALRRGPPFKKKRARGLFAKGLAYEKKALREIELACPHHLWKGQWFSYEDGNGKRRYCQPDGLTMHGGTLYIIEVKHSCLLAAYEKLNELYLPVVKGTFYDTMPVKCVQVFKHLTKGTLLAHPIVPLAHLFKKENPLTFGVHLIL